MTKPRPSPTLPAGCVGATPVTHCVGAIALDAAAKCMRR